MITPRKEEIGENSAVLYQQIGHLQARIEHLVDMVCDMKSSQSGLHKRMTHLERQIFVWKGGFAVATAAATLLGTAASKIVL